MGEKIFGSLSFYLSMVVHSEVRALKVIMPRLAEERSLIVMRERRKRDSNPICCWCVLNGMSGDDKMTSFLSRRKKWIILYFTVTLFLSPAPLPLKITFLMLLLVGGEHQRVLLLFIYRREGQWRRFVREKATPVFIVVQKGAESQSEYGGFGSIAPFMCHQRHGVRRSERQSLLLFGQTRETTVGKC